MDGGGGGAEQLGTSLASTVPPILKAVGGIDALGPLLSETRKALQEIRDRGFGAMANALNGITLVEVAAAEAREICGRFREAFAVLAQCGSLHAGIRTALQGVPWHACLALREDGERHARELQQHLAEAESYRLAAMDMLRFGSTADLTSDSSRKKWKEAARRCVWMAADSLLAAHTSSQGLRLSALMASEKVLLVLDTSR